MPFTAISPKLLKLQPRRGGGLASFFGGDFGATEVGADRLAGVGVTGRAGALAAVEAGADRFSGVGAVQIPLVAPTITGPTQVNSTTLRVGISGGAGATSWTLQKSTDGTTWTSSGSVTVGATQADATVTTGQSTQLRIAATAGATTVYSNVVTGTASVGGDMTLTGSGFGTNPDFAPVAFLDFIDTPTGTSWTGAGGSAAAFNGGEVRNDDGLPIGGGCWFDDFETAESTGVSEYFPHYAIYLNEGVDAVTCFKHVKISHFGTMTSQGAQYKSTRFMKQTGTQSAYQATPKVGSSAWRTETSSYLSKYYFPEGGGETNVPANPGGGGTGTTLNIYNNGWHATFSQARMNSADNVADGLHRVWWDGAYYSNWSGMDVRNNLTTKFWSVQHNPGLANGYRGSGLWEVRHARIVVLKGLAWAAFGNASTFGACTDLLVVEPTSWSDTAIAFDPHGTRPSGYNWMYVMKTDGTLVSTSGLTTFS